MYMYVHLYMYQYLLITRHTLYDLNIIDYNIYLQFIIRHVADVAHNTAKCKPNI